MKYLSILALLLIQPSFADGQKSSCKAPENTYSCAGHSGTIEGCEIECVYGLTPTCEMGSGFCDFMTGEPQINHATCFCAGGF